MTNTGIFQFLQNRSLSEQTANNRPILIQPMFFIVVLVYVLNMQDTIHTYSKGLHLAWFLSSPVKKFNLAPEH